MSDLYASLRGWKPDEPGDVVCPLCERKFSRLGYKLHLVFDKGQLLRIKKDHPSWTDEEGACFPCINLYRSEFKLPPLTREEMLPLVRLTK